MARGRKLTPSRSERMLGSYSYGHSQGSNGTESSELGEEDVWSMVDNMTNGDDIENDDSQNAWSPHAAGEIHDGISNFNRPSHRRIPGGDQHAGGLSLVFEDSDRTTATTTTSSRIVHQLNGRESLVSPRGRHMATSAPVNVPDWSKILRVDSVDSLHEMDDGLDDADSEIVPPHEYLARSRKSTATSIFEGVGRTLKGRDMRRVRDAVWSQTGFDG